MKYINKSNRIWSSAEINEIQRPNYIIKDERIDRQLRKYLLELPDSCVVIPTKNPKSVVVIGVRFTSIYQIEPYVEALCFKYDLEYKHNRSSDGWDITIK